MSTSSLDTEITETESLLVQAQTPGVKKLLQNHLANLKNRILELSKPAPAPSPAPVPSAPVSSAVPPKIPTIQKAGAFVPITDFAWDQGDHGSKDISIFIDLPDVGTAKDRVNCVFGKHSIDLTIMDLNGKNYRLINENLEKDIVPNECKTIVKANKIVLKLIKHKGQYSYESWTQLTSKKPRDAAEEAKKKDNPTGGIMDMMKEMYDSGDDQMKKIIGEAMLKSSKGEKSAPTPLSMTEMEDIDHPL